MPVDQGNFQKLAADYAAAWSSGDPEAVAAFYTAGGQVSVNRGEPVVGRTAIVELAAEFYTEFPDLAVHCDEARLAQDHAILVWTLEGHHSGTGNRIRLRGWEEWELDENMKVKLSRGWFDAAQYERQIAEGVG